MNPIKEKTTKLLDLFRVKYAYSAYEEKFTQYIPLEWQEKRWIGACNPHSFILVAECEENKMPDPEKKVVNLQGILPQSILFEAEMDQKELIRQWKSVPTIETDQKTQCPSCEGEGRFDHWGDTYDCQHCEETGEIKTNRKIKIKDPKYTFYIDGKLLTTDKIEKMVTTIDMLQSEKISYMVTNGNKSLALFCLEGEIIVGLARWLPLEDNDVDSEKIIDLSAKCIKMQDLETIEVMRN
ncbi:hypothetical protein [Cyclobacterium jeungdonense]|uniref:Uncharacterized protein n=1 Tax=Cyclobacterium jeungdonense TaxID=708087 RepID=A0ABT8CA72_9BACT|nr:hypothetical protein [Cyclobacterium jeungdonense]MDN3688665.1 hypothetical protein [Cyclobacterium jeungdonense]